MTERDSVGDERVARLSQATLAVRRYGRPRVTRVEVWERPARKLYFSNGCACALSAGPVELSVFHQRNDRLLPPRSQQILEIPLTCGFGARGGIRTLDLPNTRRMLGVDLDGSRRIERTHVGMPVGPDGS
jgi:hypothetical protein